MTHDKNVNASAPAAADLPFEYATENFLEICLDGDLPALQNLIAQGADIHAVNDDDLRCAVGEWIFRR